MATAKKETVKLIDTLKANISKKEDQRAIEAAERQVKNAKKAANFELSTADEAIDTAKDKLEAVLADANSSLSLIMTAQREVSLAEANHAAMTEIISARF
jgi:hypothetical protein